MRYLVDGHNLIPKLPGGSLRILDDEERLILLLQDFCRVERSSLEVYFDGAPAGYSGARSYGVIRAHFVQKGMTADQAILSRLRTLGASAKNWTVVTSDRQVIVGAKELHAQVATSEQFAQMMLDAQFKVAELHKNSDKPVSKKDIEEGLSWFGGKDKD